MFQVNIKINLGFVSLQLQQPPLLQGYFGDKNNVTVCTRKESSTHKGFARKRAARAKIQAFFFFFFKQHCQTSHNSPQVLHCLMGLL